MTGGRPLRRAALALLLVLLAACAGDRSAPAPRGGPPAGDDWRTVLAEDFEGDRLDTGRWATCYDWNVDGCTNEGNDELQWYLPGQVSVSDGRLTLTAERRDTRGSDGEVYPWRSGMISTGRDDWYSRPRQTFTYGYFEAAVRIPAEPGMFPAFWLMPASRFTPPEVDIMEFLGTSRQVDMYVHWRDAQGAEQRANGSHGPVDFAARSHVFGLLWEPDRLVWYVDGVERFRATEPEQIPHEPMEVLLNLAVGVPDPPPDQVDSARMTVDWVRVWQR
ncbi:MULTISPECIES: glycoside hydrolase family 16 protein [unclassified Streptomyces]|uniref:glycoside hydrolase family 16 protein n=1 Tax=unclassified Streptomyces TaxID=2593676 RepID=UPI003712D6D1